MTKKDNNKSENKLIEIMLNIAAFMIVFLCFAAAKYILKFILKY